MVDGQPEHPNAIRFRAAMAARADGDVGVLLELLSDEVEWWKAGADEPVRGRDGVGAILAERSESEVWYEIHDLFANDEHLVALIHAGVRHGVDQLRFSFAEVCHFDDEARINRRQAFAQNMNDTVRSHT